MATNEGNFRTWKFKKFNTLDALIFFFSILYTVAVIKKKRHATPSQVSFFDISHYFRDNLREKKILHVFQDMISLSKFAL